MELPTDVRIHNELLGLKGAAARLLQVGDGYYELRCLFGDRQHRVLMPIAGTVVIAAEPEPLTGDVAEIER